MAGFGCHNRLPLHRLRPNCHKRLPFHGVDGRGPACSDASAFGSVIGYGGCCSPCRIWQAGRRVPCLFVTNSLQLSNRSASFLRGGARATGKRARAEEDAARCGRSWPRGVAAAVVGRCPGRESPDAQAFDGANALRQAQNGAWRCRLGEAATPLSAFHPGSQGFQGCICGFFPS